MSAVRNSPNWAQSALLQWNYQKTLQKYTWNFPSPSPAHPRLPCTLWGVCRCLAATCNHGKVSEETFRLSVGPAKTDTAEVDASCFLQHEGNWLYVFALTYIQYFLLDLLNAEFPSRVDKAMQSNGCDKKIEWAEAKSVLKLIFHWPDFWEPSTIGGLHWCEVLCDAEILGAPFFSKKEKKN